MKTADLLANYCGQTFSDHTEAIQWIERNCLQLEADARHAALTEAGKIVQVFPIGKLPRNEDDVIIRDDKMIDAILSLRDKKEN